MDTTISTPEIGFEIHAGVWHDEGFERRTVQELAGGAAGSDFTDAWGPNLDS